MEKLITCSTILYDKVISDKMDELTRLKKKYEKPKIKYANLEEWKTKQKEAYQFLKNGLDNSIITDYEEMIIFGGLTDDQSWDIRVIISEALNLITKDNNKEWVENVSFDIINNIVKGLMDGLVNSGRWNILHHLLDAKTMSNIIYYNIIWNLGPHEDAAIKGILDDVIIFTCEMCKKIYYFNDENICLDCEPILDDI